MDLVLDIGKFRVKGAFFEADRIDRFFVLPLDMALLSTTLASRGMEKAIVSSTNPSYDAQVKTLLTSLGVAYHPIDFSTVKIALSVEEPQLLGHDRIANVYGALFRFPQNDCIVVDLGKAVTFDYVGSTGSYLGGAIYPGVDLGMEALAQYTEKVAKVAIEYPEEAVGKTTKGQVQSGLYWGLLGAIERIVSEMRQNSPSPSDVKIIATGGAILSLSPEKFTKDLSDLVDLIDPALTLIGIHEIMKEQQKEN